ncbi:MAG: FtsX-like permease family protein [Planctomycetes bacterium]|nr:FtsX-like permease family protein [Planctomycetota bacterium]
MTDTSQPASLTLDVAKPLGQRQAGRPPRTPLALRNLLHEKLRTGVAMIGVAFAVVLILMQLGFFFSVVTTATLTYKQLDFQIALVSVDYLHLGKPGDLPRQRLEQAANVPGVAAARPFYIGFQMWLHPDRSLGKRRSMMLLGFDPDDKTFTSEEIDRQREALRLPGRVLIDRRSRDEFGNPQPGMQTELGGTAVEVVGTYSMGTGFSANGGATMSENTFRQILSFWSPDRMSMGLLRVDPKFDVNQVAKQLTAALPADTWVLTHDQLDYEEQYHWVVKTQVGIIFGLGVLVALLVGMGVVYQVLSSDIARRIAEYATLAAMGYTPRYLARTVVMQAVILAVAGFLPGLITASFLFRMAAAEANLPMEMTWQLASSVFLICVGMCLASGQLAIRKLRSVDPADLFN